MRIQRLIAIISVLMQNKTITAKRLSEMFDVSVRTIYRDIEAIETSGIPIITYPGVNGGIGIIEEYKINKELFTNEDISNLLIGLQTMAPTMSANQLNQTITKIKALIPDNYSKQIELSTNQLYIDMTPWAKSPKFNKRIDLIKIGLVENKVLKIEYKGRDRIQSIREIEPHQLILKENNWYLKAFCINKKDFRVFRLDRIIDLKLTKDFFERKEFENSVTDMKEWKSPDIIVVDLIMDESLKERILEYCNEENLEYLPNGKILVHLPFVESDLGYEILLSFGEKAECISPKHIRNELKNRIKKAWSIYKD